MLHATPEIEQLTDEQIHEELASIARDIERDYGHALRRRSHLELELHLRARQHQDVIVEKSYVVRAVA